MYTALPHPALMMSPLRWYALRVYYSGSKKVIRIRDVFMGDGIETFVPMHLSDVTDPNDPERPLEVPAVKELLMVRAPEHVLSHVRERHTNNRDLHYVDYYRHRHGEKKGFPIVIPDSQMQAFISYVQSCEETINYYTDEQLRGKKGRAVEVIAGQFKGVRGILMRIEKNRHVVITLPDLLGASLPHIPVHMLRFINE